MAMYKASKKSIRTSLVIPQKRHTEYWFYVKEPEYFEWADSLNYPVVAPLENGKYIVFSGLERYYFLRLDVTEFITVYVLEDLEAFELEYLKCEKEHPFKRLRTIFDALTMVRLVQHPILLADTGRYHEAMAVITEMPLDLIKKLDALLVHSSYEIWAEFYEGTIDLEDALYQTFEAI